MPVKPRHDGWTPARQNAFIGALADTGSVSRAARYVNMSPEGAYYLRRRPGAEGFRRAWEAALRKLTAGAIPPPVLAPMTMQEMMLILAPRPAAAPDRKSDPCQGPQPWPHLARGSGR